MPVSQITRSLRASGTLRSLRHTQTLAWSSRTVYPTSYAPPITLTRTITTSSPLKQQSATPPSTSSTSGIPASKSTTSSGSTSGTPADRASRVIAPTPNQQTTPNISKTGLSDKPLELETTPEEKIDWTRSFHGLSAAPFPKEAADVLLAPTDPEEVEIKPDGILYLPEIKYRRILNKAFGPGGWGLVPRSESIVTPKTVTREYALVCNGRLVSVARGEQDYFSPDGIPTATEGCRSNALVRCCKDLGIASELWDPRWIRKFKAAHSREVWVEHVVNKRKSKIWTRKDDPVGYPWKETK
ncbi:putative mitochondrial genome maintenance protein Mgm101 [Aspergillus ruber CBS 135680]|uniref:Mitochondrial genome maintenance protein MGM101 n=1 Tax=Aspergillus ruber (strain CBS 135680) TaxID=1388766 RepID=A0A017SFB4_ASPRC|nr:Mgm101p-domain-containing protein [Aspergillus ruber CBS 135680]EYE95627.1 Mgm101p-domain-containing protein [Aspergillus ruber CBS 135680]